MSLKSKLTRIADAIRSIFGITTDMNLDEMGENLEDCGDALIYQSDLLDYAIELVSTKASAPSDPLLESKAVNPSEVAQTVVPSSGFDGLLSVYVGAISNTYVGTAVERKDSGDLVVSGATVTAPAGYYDSESSKSVNTTEQAEPSITVSSSGLITATSAQDAGYVLSGTKTSTSQLTTKAAETITPGTTNKTISSGTYLVGTQTISGDANLVPENIKKGVSIFGVNGISDVAASTYTTTSKLSSNSTSISFTGLYGEPSMFAVNPTGNISLGSTRYVTGVKYDGSTTHGTYGYRSGSSGTTYYSSSYFTWTYSNGTLTIKTSSTTNGGYFSSSVTYQIAYVVGVEPGGIQLPTLTNEGSSSDLLSGKQLIDQDGNVVTGSIQSKSATTYTPKATSQTIASGVYLSGAQTIAGDSNLVSANIKSGVSIFGVNGSYAGNSSGSGLPTGVSKLTSGTFTLTTDAKRYSIQHNLGAVPNFLLVFVVGDVIVENYHDYIYRYVLFSQTVSMDNGYYTLDVLGSFDCGYSSDGTSYLRGGTIEGQLSDYFTDTTAIITGFDLYTSNDFKLKSNTPYRWICGVADF